jgi:hypothetical protein
MKVYPAAPFPPGLFFFVHGPEHNPWKDKTPALPTAINAGKRSNATMVREKNLTNNKKIFYK